MTGEITAAIKGSLRKSAKEVLEHTDELQKKLDNLVIEENNLKRKLTNDEIDDFFKHLEEVAERRKIVDGGLRGSKVLSTKQKEEILEYSKKYFDESENIEEKIQFAAAESTNDTGYMASFDITYINTDIMPGQLDTANSRLSWKAAIAHELEGHRRASLFNKTVNFPELSIEMNNLLEEIQASVRSSKYGQDLSEIERYDLMQDAIERFKNHKDIISESKYKNLTFEQLIAKLWI